VNYLNDMLASPVGDLCIFSDKWFT